MPSDKDRVTLCSHSGELITPPEEHATLDHTFIHSEGRESSSAWHADVFLMVTMLLPPLAVRIVRGKIVGRRDLTVVHQEVMYELAYAMILAFLHQVVPAEYRK